MKIMKYIKLLKKIKYKTLPKNRILIFDKKSEKLLQMTVLKNNLKYNVLHIRREVFYISISIIVNSLKNWLKFNMLSLMNQNKIDKNFKKISFIYYLSNIESLSPRVVITTIFNADSFYQLSNCLKHIEFIAIQNGLKTYDDFNEEKIEMKDTKLFCFGEAEKDMFSQHGYDTSNFFPVGSLKASYYTHKLSNGSRIKYDICIVSGYREYDQFDDAGDIYYKKLSEFLKTSNLKRICIACKSQNNQTHDREIKYFSNYFDNVKFIKNNLQELSTYKAMHESDITISFNSTASIEAFGWGKKILFCDWTAYKYLPLPDMCCVFKDEIDLFETKLINLINIDYEDYINLNKKDFKYFINYNPQNPPHKIIRRKILNLTSE